MGAESCEKSKSFLATFGPKLWSKTIFVHARYGAMGHESFVHGSGGMRRRVWFKIQKLRSPPREAKKSNTQPLSRTLNLARCTQREAPSSSHQPECMALNLEVSNKAPALPIELTQDLMDAFEIISNVFGGSALGQASMKAMQCLPLAWACLALKEAGKKAKDVRDREASRSYQSGPS